MAWLSPKARGLLRALPSQPMSPCHHNACALVIRTFRNCADKQHWRTHPAALGACSSQPAVQYLTSQAVLWACRRLVYSCPSSHYSISYAAAWLATGPALTSVYTTHNTPQPARTHTRIYIGTHGTHARTPVRFWLRSHSMDAQHGSTSVQARYHTPTRQQWTRTPHIDSSTHTYASAHTPSAC